MIELLVVVAILAILAGIATMAVRGLNQDADENACKMERQTLIAAMGAVSATLRTDDSYGDYIQNGVKYFTNSGTPTAPNWGPRAGEHPGGSCPTTIPTPTSP